MIDEKRNRVMETSLPLNPERVTRSCAGSNEAWVQHMMHSVCFYHVLIPCQSQILEGLTLLLRRNQRLPPNQDSEMMVSAPSEVERTMMIFWFDRLAEFHRVAPPKRTTP